MVKFSWSRTTHHIRNLLGIILSITSGFLIIYKAFNLNINTYVMLLNVTSCLLGITIYVICIFAIYRNNKEHGKENFKIIFNAIDKISNGDFSVSIDKDENKFKEHNGHKNIANELAGKVNTMAKQLSNMEMMRQDFVSNVSHEIQSPLTSIQGFAVLLKNDNLSKEDKNTYLEIINSETKRLSKLSNNLLKLSALDSGTKELQINKYDLGKQLRNVILFLEPQWSKKNIEFEIECPKTNVNADEELMSEVWINLLSNGIKFTPNDGKIYVSIKRDAKNLQVTIKDSGIGIKEKEQKHIFERFYMSDKSRKRELGGNGLGLSIVKKIIDLHEGNIRVKSEENIGTEFIVSLLIE